MFCSKCNTEIPDGSRFCISCGEPVLQKKFCVKCGSELKEGAKFCAVCGTRVEDAVPPVQSGAAESVKTPSQAASVPEPVSAPATAIIPEPVENTAVGAWQQPSQSSAPSPEKPSDAVFGGGYIPPYTPSKLSKDAQTPTVVSNAPAAAVVKKSAKKPVIIAVVAVLVAALIGGVIFYITNSAVVLSTFMGKANYAAMVEGNSIKQAAAQLDRNSLSNGIKSASGVYASVSSITSDENGSLLAKLSDSATNTDVVDLSSLFAAIYGSVKDTYGVNSVMFTVGMNANLTDTAREMLKYELYLTDEQIDEMLGYLNNTKLSAGITAGESAAAFKAGAEIKSLKVDLKLLVNSNGEAYVVLPFASEKALLFKVGEIAEDEIEFSGTNESVALEFDEKEIERILNEIVEVYIEHFKSAEVEMENGELSVSGVSVSGKVLTAEFDGDKLEELISDIGGKLAKDEYFKNKIVEYFNECGIEISKSEYEEAISDLFSELTFDSSAKLKVTTIINNSGTVLGKSYQLSAGSGKVKLSFAGANNESAFEIKSEADGETVSVTVKNVSESDTDGTVTVKLSAKGTSATLKVKYKDAKTEKFCGKDVVTGTYEVSVSLPKDFAEENGSYANYSELLADTKLVFGSSISGSTCTSSFGLISDKLGEITFTCALTAEDNTSDLKTPLSVLDFSPYVDGDEPDDAFKQELIEYLESVRDAISGQNAGELGESAAEAIDDIISSATQASAEEVNALTSAILSGRNSVLGLSSKYGVSDLYNESFALYQRYNDLYLDFTSIYYEKYSISSDEYAEFMARLDELEEEKNKLEQRYIEESEESALN